MTTIKQILDARTIDTLLEPGEDKKDAYHRLAKLCHPDHHPGNKDAEEAFKHLNDMQNGTSPAKVTVGKWTIEATLCAGDVANLYITERTHETSVCFA